MTTRLKENNFEGHGVHDFGIEFAWKQRSAGGHSDEEYEPSSEDPRQPPEALTDMHEGH